MDGWNTIFLLGRPIFRGYVSFREGTPQKTNEWIPKIAMFEGSRELPAFQTIILGIHVSFRGCTSY